MTALPMADACRWPRLVTRARPRQRTGALATTYPARIVKPVVDARGRAGLAVELPDIYPDTAALARHCLEAALDGGGAQLAPDASPAVPPMLAALAAALPADACLAADGDRAVLRHGAFTASLAWDGCCLTVALPRRHDVPRTALAALRPYAARLNAEVRLARLEVAGRQCGFEARLPVEPLVEADAERLCAATCMAIHELAALARAVPDLATLVDPAFRPVLALAGAGRPRPVSSSRPRRHR